MTLSKDEEVQLSELYQAVGWKVLKKVLEAKIVEFGLKALNSRTEAYTAELRGFTQALYWLQREMKENNKQTTKIEEVAH